MKNDWVEINNDSQRKYNKDHQSRFKSLMLMPSLCDYSFSYVLVSGTVTITEAITITEAGTDGNTKRGD